MLENETQDANNEQISTSESVDETTPVESESQQVKDGESKEAGAVDNTPFHEHPRFKELVTQKNEAQTQLKQYQQALDEMRQQVAGLQKSSASQQQTKAQNPLIERLKGIDSEFGKEMEELSGLKSQFSEFQEWKAQAEAERFQTQVKQEMSALHSENKVPDSLKAKYENEIKAIAQSNPNLGLKDLKTIYKQVHEDYSKLIEDIKREERKQYVTDKKKDASIPKSPSKGAVPPKSTQKPAEKLSREELLASIKDSAIKGFHDSQDI